MTLPWLRPGVPRGYSFAVSQASHRVKLDQNESPLDVPAELKADIARDIAARAWNRYVQPAEYLEAKKALGGVFGLAPENLAITVGCDQAIEAAFLIAGGPGRRARWFEPTYPYIAHLARKTFTEGDPVKLGEFVESMIQVGHVEAEPRPDLIVFVAPNNPTGCSARQMCVEAALSDESRLVLVDEAYYEFSRRSFLANVPERPNLLVARSLSKLMLAGVHLGFVAGHADAIAIIERMFSAPYHLDLMQLTLARRYPELAPYLRRAAEKVIAERERVRHALFDTERFTPLPSVTNFIAFKVVGGRDRASALYRALVEDGVRIRDIGGLHGMAGYLRVTIGTPEENDIFLDAICRAGASIVDGNP